MMEAALWGSEINFYIMEWQVLKKKAIWQIAAFSMFFGKSEKDVELIYVDSVHDCIT